MLAFGARVGGCWQCLLGEMKPLLAFEAMEGRWWLVVGVDKNEKTNPPTCI